MYSTVEPVRALFRVIGGPGRRWFWAASGLQAIERVALALTTVWLVRAGPAAAIVPAVGLGAVFLVRTALSARLRVVARARVIDALTSALVADGVRLGESAHRDTELALIDGVYAAEDVLGQRLPALVGDAPACVVLAVLVVWLEPWHIVVEASVAVILGACAALLARRVTSVSAERLWTAFVPVLEDLSTAIHARLEIVANGGRDEFLAGLGAKLTAWEGRSTRAAWSSFLAGRVPTVAAVLGVGAFLVLRGESPVEQLATLAVFVGIMPAFAGLARGALDLRRDLVRATPVMRSLNEAQVAPPNGSAVPSIPGPIEWREVTFAYAGQSAPTLHDVNVAWTSGELLGLSGRNGSGKSTFLRLLLAMAPPTAGTLDVDGTSIVDVDRASFRRSVGYLPQRPFLSERMSVRQAIELIAPEAQAEAVEAILARLALWQVLVARDALAPLDVKLGALSAGEKQRVAIARVVLRDPALLILDEPDANLDAEGVMLLGSLLREESRQRMVVFAAHDRLLLAVADRVVAFEDGRASEVVPQRSSMRGHGPVAPVA